MSDKQVFVDTSILVYAHDVAAGEKHTRARQGVAELWVRPLPASVSIQVLQESYVNLARKGATNRAARGTVEDYLRWDVIPHTPRVLSEGMRLAERFRLSLWDAMIIAAARQAGARVVWSENLNAGQDYEGVTVENPL